MLINIIVWLKRRLNIHHCGKCGKNIPFGKSAWHDNNKEEWVCDPCMETGAENGKK